MSRKIRKIASLFIILCLFLTSILPVSAKSAAIPKHWASGVIQKWVSEGLLQGYTDGTLKPDNTISRTDFLTLVCRIFNYTDKSDTKVKDIPAVAWYADSISKALAMNLVKVDANGNIKPQESITKLEAAVIIAAAFHLEAKSIDSLARFTDADRIPAESKAAISAMVEKGILQGYTDKTFGYARKITRAEAFTMLDRAMGTLKKAPGTYTGAVAGNLVVNSKDVILKDMTIKGDLYLTQGIGNGDLTLENVKIEGSTYVFGGGMNTIRVRNSILSGTLFVQKRDGNLRILTQGSTEIPNARILSGVKLEEEGNTGSGFGILSIEPGTVNGGHILLSGSFPTVNCSTSGSSIQILSGSITNLLIGAGASNTQVTVSTSAAITNLTADASLTVSGQGAITNANINTTGVVIEQKPANVVVGAGINATIGGSTVNGTPVAVTPSPSTVVNPPASVPATNISGLISFDIVPAISTAASIQLKQNGSNVGFAIHPNDDCTYTLTGIAAGTYSLEVTLSGYKTAVVTGLVVNGSPVTRNFTLLKKIIVGKVAISGGTADLTQASLQLYESSVPTGSAIHPDTNGDYCFTGIASGTYDLELSLAGYETTTLSAINVVAGTLVDKGTTTLTAILANISGTVTFAAIGGNIALTSIQLKNGNVATGSAIHPAADGSYTITGVPPGTYSIEVSLAGYKTVSLQGVQVVGADITGKDAILTQSTPTLDGFMSLSHITAVPGDIEDIQINYRTGEPLDNGTVVFTLPDGFIATTDDIISISSSQSLTTNLAQDQITNSGKTITLTNVNAPTELQAYPVNMSLQLSQKVIPNSETYSFSATSDADGANTIKSPSTGTGNENRVLVSTNAPIHNLKATAQNSSVLLEFSKPTGATSVTLEMSINENDNYSTLSNVLNSDSTSTLINGLTKGTLYYFRLQVTGGNHNGTSNFVISSPSLVDASKSQAIINQPIFLNYTSTNPISSKISLKLKDTSGNPITANESFNLRVFCSSSTTTSFKVGTADLQYFNGDVNVLVPITTDENGLCEFDITFITTNSNDNSVNLVIKDSSGNDFQMYNNF